MKVKVVSFIVILLLGCLIKQTFSTSDQPQCLKSNSCSNTLYLQEKLLNIFGGNTTDSIILLKALQGSGFMQLLTNIPQPLVDLLLQQLSSGIIHHLPENFNFAKNFNNWGETIKVDYDQILYPTDYQPEDQIKQIQRFVKEGAEQGKRIRGAGNRHSWSNIFSDPEQLLVSFYPYTAADGTSQSIGKYDAKMVKLSEELQSKDIEYLNLIRKVGEINIEITKESNNLNAKKHLVKIGASVSNNQLRMWSIKNGYQYKSNTIIADVSFVGALSTCSHGSGIATQTLCDYVHEIQFIDYKGNRQIISKTNHPDLIKTAASSLGLLGLVIFVTIQMEDLQIVQTLTRISYKDHVIPWPKNYAHQQERLERPQWKQWVATNSNEEWLTNYNRFKKAVTSTYSQWFYFPIEGSQVAEYVWTSHQPKKPQNIEKIFANNGVFIEDYPSGIVLQLSKFTQFIANKLVNFEATQSMINLFMKNPFELVPKANLFLNYPDAVHFERGVRNNKCLDFQVQINVPSINNEGVIQPDYDLIQKIWWAGLQIAEKKSDVINMVLQMRFFKGSKATLAPQMGYDYACSIEIVRTLALTQAQKQLWKQTIIQIFNAWKSILDSNGDPVVIRPHWGKEWDQIPEVKTHVLGDEALKTNIHTFLSDYEKIAQLKGFDYLKNLETFSNQLYRELLNNGIGIEGPQIK